MRYKESTVLGTTAAAVRRFSARRGVLGAVALAAASVYALLPVNAAAAKFTSWTVTPGGPASLGGPISIGPFSCPSWGLSGSFISGTGLPGNGLLTITSVNGSGPCSDGVNSVSVSPGNLPWSFNAVSYQSGVAVGNVSDVSLSLQYGFLCIATVTGPGSAPGTIDASYSNGFGSAALTLAGGNMEVTAASGCDPTVIKVGDPMPVYANLHVTPVQTITSP
ncbi:hypothetical protein [Spirillospora sp. NPDC048823]|uniref:hypothetical protein n=1 Tax=unclassified Spirillospora TaxID=2642701 RepID=UPI0037156649